MTTIQTGTTRFHAIRTLSRQVVAAIRKCADDITKAALKQRPPEHEPEGSDVDWESAAIAEQAVLTEELERLRDSASAAMDEIVRIPAPKLSDELRRVLILREMANGAKIEKKRVDDALAAAEKAAIDRMTDEEVSSMRVDGYTVYTSRVGYCSKANGVTTEELVQALRIAPLGNGTFADFVRDSVNLQGLKSTINEMAKRYEEEHPGSTIEDALPEALRGKLRIYEEQGLRVKKG